MISISLLILTRVSFLRNVCQVVLLQCQHFSLSVFYSCETSHYVQFILGGVKGVISTSGRWKYPHILFGILRITYLRQSYSSVEDISSRNYMMLSYRDSKYRACDSSLLIHIMFIVTLPRFMGSKSLKAFFFSSLGDVFMSLRQVEARTEKHRLIFNSCPFQFLAILVLLLSTVS